MRRGKEREKGTESYNANTGVVALLHVHSKPVGLATRVAEDDALRDTHRLEEVLQGRQFVRLITHIHVVLQDSLHHARLVGAKRERGEEVGSAVP
jgi:hypothetical protein